MDCTFIKNNSKEKSVIVIEAYHSGTSLATPEILAFFSKLTRSHTVLMASYPSKFIDHPYESTKKLMDSGVGVYKNIAAELLYVYAYMSCVFDVDIKYVLSEFKLTSREIA
jgi:hypothetical protein